MVTTVIKFEELIKSLILPLVAYPNDVEIIDKEKESKTSDKVVDFWSTVTFKMEDDEKEYTVRIVGTWEVTVDWELAISLESPVGQAIRGKKVGETAKMRHESWRKNIKILAIA